ncbi:MAG: hypothetical protein WC309_01450 [Candidatus Paceibacterota bacterium]|jgi:hypothetical protein|nr:hypothetical protein [Candidatus Paceibacterota bacterium]
MEGKEKNKTGLSIERKDRENSKQLVGRFFRHLRQSGIMRQAKGSIYRKRPLSRASKIKAALRRNELRRIHEKEEKMGKIS